MVRLPHQRDEEDEDDQEEDPLEPDDEDDDDNDPITAIFRIIEQYYEGVAKREDEGMGVG